MTELVRSALSYLRSGKYKSRRVTRSEDELNLNAKYPGISGKMMPVKVFSEMLKMEEPNILEHDIYGFNRRNTIVPYFLAPNGAKNRGGGASNLTPNYIHAIEVGFDGLKRELEAAKTALGGKRSEFFDAEAQYIDAVLEISERYRIAAEKEGNIRLAKALETVPRKPATSFYEACLFFKIIVYTLRCVPCTHITIGRFDQYMYRFYKNDIAQGVSREELLETLELLFIALNYDGDLYAGVQQGDNGQSMVLGGYDEDGNDMYNELSELCMEASLELSLIDPKINLRVSKKTEDARYEYATKLTKQGLGFPQYCNDDIAVPYLISLGYDKEDAYNYTVAACWEYIVPNCAKDSPNNATMDFPGIVGAAIRESLTKVESFDELMDKACQAIAKECDRIVEMRKPKIPLGENMGNYNYLSLFIDGCVDKGLDVCQGGAKYYNLGCHGAGIAPAADALMAVKQVVFEEKSATPEELIAALEADFEGYAELQNKLLSCPKMGNNRDCVDVIAAELMNAFSDNLHGRPNGITPTSVWRAGTGSAMEYILTAKKCPATADGRNAGKPYGSSFSPAITTKLDGPLSVIQSFTKHDMSRICNGGPLTMEVHDTVFRNEEGEKKVAQLVKAFVHLGGHQLQLNAINRERLLDAKAHPENHKNLIVRVWGWSGYFCELDSEYQDHVISRTEFTV